VTPSYNQAQFLRQAIEGVLSQAGEFEIEYFVMDGGSTDGSVKIIGEYADQVTSGAWPVRCTGISMTWISRRDNGQADAINQGFSLATGDIVSWINSDDTYTPGAFACVAAEFARRPEADFIYGDGDVIDEAGNLQWEWLSRPYDLRVLTSYHFLWNDFTNYIMQQATFWRRSVFDRIGFLDESFHYCMDIEYWIRAGSKGLKLNHVPHKLARFRLIPGTKSLSSPTIFWEDYLEIFRRYLGADRMAKRFAFYYYNLAKQYECDIAKIVNSKSDVLNRWRELPGNEQQALRRKAEFGFNLACYLIADDLLRRGHSEQARRFAREGVSQRLSPAFHPFAWPYLVRRLVGPGFSATADRLGQMLIRNFRQRVYDYRYHEKHTIDWNVR